MEEEMRAPQPRVDDALATAAANALEHKRKRGGLDDALYAAVVLYPNVDADLENGDPKKKFLRAMNAACLGTYAEDKEAWMGMDYKARSTEAKQALSKYAPAYVPKARTRSVGGSGGGGGNAEAETEGAAKRKMANTKASIHHSRMVAEIEKNRFARMVAVKVRTRAPLASPRLCLLSFFFVTLQVDAPLLFFLSISPCL